jgi:hypothetical protein
MVTRYRLRHPVIGFIESMKEIVGVVILVQVNRGQDSKKSDQRTVLVAVPVVIPIMIMVVPLSVVIPAMIVCNTTVITLPIPFEKTFAVVTGCNPVRLRIGWPSPVSIMPFVVISDRIPVAPDPHEIRSWAGRQDSHNARRRRCANSDSYRNLSIQHARTGQQR